MCPCRFILFFQINLKFFVSCVVKHHLIVFRKLSAVISAETLPTPCFLSSASPGRHRDLCVLQGINTELRGRVPLSATQTLAVYDLALQTTASQQPSLNLLICLNSCPFEPFEQICLLFEGDLKQTC